LLDNERSSSCSTVGTVLGTSLREGPTQEEYLQPYLQSLSLSLFTLL